MKEIQGHNSSNSKHPNNKSFQSVFHKIWNPTQDDIIKTKMLFRLSLTAGMVLSLILYMLGNNQILAYIFISCFFLIIVLRITMAIRIQLITSSNIKPKSNKLFSKLPDKNRKKFFMLAFVYMPIGYILGIAPFLVFINYMSKSKGTAIGYKVVIFICILCLTCLLLVVYSIWNYYNTLSQDKEDICY